MRDVFRVQVRHGSEAPLYFERAHTAAGYAFTGDAVVCFPDDRAVYVDRTIYDLNNEAVYSLLTGVLHENAEQFVKDVEWLRDQGWQEAKHERP